MTLVDVDDAMLEEARQVLGGLFGQCRALEESIGALEAKIMAHAQGDDAARRLATVRSQAKSLPARSSNSRAERT